MRTRNFTVSIFLISFLGACTNVEKEKKAGLPEMDTSAIIQDTPLVETVFPDTIAINPAKESVLLKFNFQKGRTYNYAMNFDLVQANGEQKRSTLMKWNYDMEVIDSEKDVKTIKTTYKTIEMTTDMGGGQKLEFSSEKKADVTNFMQLPSKMFSIIKGKSFVMQVNDKGEIVSVTGHDKIGEAVLSEMKLPAQMKPMVEQTFKQQFSDSSVKEMFSQWFSVYPNKTVKTGDTWKSNTAITGLNQSASTVYTVKNIKGNDVFVGGESKLPGELTKSAISSKLIIDARTGLMIDGVFEQKKDSTQKTRFKSRITGKQL